MLTRLCLDFSYLNEYKFTHSFQEFMNPLCSGSLEIRTHLTTFCTGIILQKKSYE